MPRTSLYVPATRLDRVAKALASGADEVIVDLEDAVPPTEKDAARTALREWVGQNPGTPVWVRANPDDLRAIDIEALAPLPSVVGFCLAKAESAEEVGAVAAHLDRLGSAAMLAPILEDAAAVLDARAIASAPRVVRVQLGEADLRAALGIEPSESEIELLWIRSQVVLASSAAGIDPPMGPASTDFADLAALRTTSERLRRMGFGGRTCIHPAQVAIINDVFTPTTEQVAKAAAVLRAFRDGGDGAGTAGDGQLIDLAVARQAERVLRLAGISPPEGA